LQRAGWLFVYGATLGGHMDASQNSREHVERDPRNDPRRTHAEEVVIERQPVIADSPRAEPEWPAVKFERRRSERRRIERTGTDI
jgi:hypothetical protein